MNDTTDTNFFRGRWRPALIVGAIAAIVSVIGGIFNARLFFHAYLTAYVFWLDIALGCLAVLMIQNLAGGFWGAVTRRPMEAAARTLPLLAVLFIPIVIGMGQTYPWAAGVQADVKVPGFNHAYLNPIFFIVRAVIYFAVWILLEELLVRWSLRRDTDPDPALTQRMRSVSAVGLVVLTITVFYAAVDWLMSPEVPWHSSVFPAMISTGALLAGFAFVIAFMVRFADRAPFAAVTSPYFFNTLGSLLLAFLMLWAYMEVSQLILQYAGNLPDEISWYVKRISGIAWWGALFVGVFNFMVPFGFLIIRGAKRSRRILGWVAVEMLVAHFINMYWIVEPAFQGDSSLVALFVVALMIAVGGLWLAYFARQLGAWPLLSPTDPKLIAHMQTELARE